MIRIFVAILMLVAAPLLVASRSPTATWSPSPSIRSTVRTPAYVVTLPLYVLAFVILILGVALGGIVGWFTPGQAAPLSRAGSSRELNRVRAELDRALREKATQEAALRGMRATATTAPARLPAN